MTYLWYIAIPIVALFIGYTIGRRHGAEDGRTKEREHWEHVLQVEPLDRDPNTPTNLDSPPSRVSRGMISRKSRWQP